jgi:beta-glucanase (GH16 family)
MKNIMINFKNNIVRYRKIFFIIVVIINFSCGFTTVEKEGFSWQITFEDNFDTYDHSKWINTHDNGKRTIWSNKELEWYKEENVEVENGILKLTAKPESIYGKDEESEKQFEFTSGMICNAKSFTQAYGKWEMKVRFPFKKGFWPAFFLVPVQRPTLPEIDVFEYFGRTENEISCTNHWGVDYPGASTGGQREPFYFINEKKITGDFSDKWMIWSFECYPNKMVWKLDGKIVKESTEGIPTAPLYMIANVAVKDWSDNNTGLENDGVPYVMEIDYVKIYKMVPNN